MGLGVRALVWNFSQRSSDCLVTDGIVIVEEKQTNCFASDSTTSVSTYRMHTTNVGVIIKQDQLCSKYYTSKI